MYIVMKKIILLFGSLLVFAGCRDFWERIVHTRYGIFARNDTMEELYVYGAYPNCNTLLPASQPVLERLAPAENLMSSPYLHILCESYDWSDALASTDTVRLFFFESKIVSENEWSVISRDNLVLQRYDLTKDDLNRLNWRIAYPPTEDMMDVCMWPPYNELKQR